MEEIFQKHLNEEEEYMDENENDNDNENDDDYGEIGGDWEEDEDYVGLPVIGVNVFDVQKMETNLGIQHQNNKKTSCAIYQNNTNVNNESSHEKKSQHDDNNNINRLQRNGNKDITHDIINNQNINKNFKNNGNLKTKHPSSQNQKFVKNQNDSTNETNHGNYGNCNLLLFFVFKYRMPTWGIVFMTTLQIITFLFYTVYMPRMNF